MWNLIFDCIQSWRKVKNLERDKFVFFSQEIHLSDLTNVCLVIKFNCVRKVTARLRLFTNYVDKEMESVSIACQIMLISCGLLVRTPNFSMSDGQFESDQKPTTPGESWGLSTLTSPLWNGPLNRKPRWSEPPNCPMIALRGQMLGHVHQCY